MAKADQIKLQNAVRLARAAPGLTGEIAAVAYTVETWDNEARMTPVERAEARELLAKLSALVSNVEQR